MNLNFKTFPLVVLSLFLAACDVPFIVTSGGELKGTVVEPPET